MRFNDHSGIANSHAFLSPSQYHWLRYDDEKLLDRYHSLMAKSRGTKLHAIAAECIEMGIRLKGSNTLAMYVNDSIGYGMTPEQPLYYSDFCYGTADAISFRNRLLRIHDLKTGETPASMDQLLIYAALFCLEYKMKPGAIKMELRIYQSNECSVLVPEADDILPIMDRIRYFDEILQHAYDY